MIAGMSHPQPDCIYGYTQGQLDSILGPRRIEFNRWMYGQTGAICDGRRYDHNLKTYVETGCGPHGMVVYSWDLKRFLQNHPVID